MEENEDISDQMREEAFAANLVFMGERRLREEKTNKYSEIVANW
jgi:hypothetical protein